MAKIRRRGEKSRVEKTEPKKTSKKVSKKVSTKSKEKKLKKEKVSKDPKVVISEFNTLSPIVDKVVNLNLPRAIIWLTIRDNNWWQANRKRLMSFIRRHVKAIGFKHKVDSEAVVEHAVKARVDGYFFDAILRDEDLTYLAALDLCYRSKFIFQAKPTNGVDDDPRRMIGVKSHEEEPTYLKMYLPDEVDDIELTTCIFETQTYLKQHLYGIESIVRLQQVNQMTAHNEFNLFKESTEKLDDCKLIQASGIPTRGSVVYLYWSECTVFSNCSNGTTIAHPSFSVFQVYTNDYTTSEYRLSPESLCVGKAHTRYGVHSVSGCNPISITLIGLDDEFEPIKQGAEYEHLIELVLDMHSPATSSILMSMLRKL